MVTSRFGWTPGRCRCSQAVDRSDMTSSAVAEHPRTLPLADTVSLVLAAFSRPRCMAPTLDSLPLELYYAILSHIPTFDLQSTVLALTRAAPRSAIPGHLIFHHVRLRYSDQVVRLHRRLRRSPEDADRVRSFALDCWTVDADVVVNLTALLHNLKELTLLIGPNFAPEHMEEMFQKPKEGLELISLRFRP